MVAAALRLKKLQNVFWFEKVQYWVSYSFDFAVCLWIPNCTDLHTLKWLCLKGKLELTLVAYIAEAESAYKYRCVSPLVHFFFGGGGDGVGKGKITINEMLVFPVL